MRASVSSFSPSFQTLKWNSEKTGASRHAFSSSFASIRIGDDARYTSCAGAWPRNAGANSSRAANARNLLTSSSDSSGAIEILVQPPDPAPVDVALAHGVARTVPRNRIRDEFRRHPVILQHVIQLIGLRHRDAVISCVG